MRDDDTGHAVSVHQLVHKLKHFHLVPDVEIGSRFIEEQRLRFLGQRARDPNTLPLTTRQCGNPPVFEFGDVAPLERPSYGGTVCGTGRTQGPHVRIPTEENGLTHPEGECRFLTLRHHTNDTGQLSAFPRLDRLARHGHGTGVGAQDADE